MSERFELKISDKVKIIKSKATFVIKAENDEMVLNPKTKEMVKCKPTECYYEVLYQAVTRGIHMAIERENPNSVEKYLKLLEIFRDEVLSTADFVEHKYKVVRVAP